MLPSALPRARARPTVTLAPSRSPPPCHLWVTTSLVLASDQSPEPCAQEGCTAQTPYLRLPSTCNSVKPPPPPPGQLSEARQQGGEAKPRFTKPQVPERPQEPQSPFPPPNASGHRSPWIEASGGISEPRRFRVWCSKKSGTLSGEAWTSGGSRGRAVHRGTWLVPALPSVGAFSLPRPRCPQTLSRARQGPTPTAPTAQGVLCTCCQPGPGLQPGGCSCMAWRCQTPPPTADLVSLSTWVHEEGVPEAGPTAALWQGANCLSPLL